MVAGMSLQEKVGQMTQIDISLVMTDKKLDPSKVQHWLGVKKVGSILNSPYSGRDCDANGPTGLSASEWRDVVHSIQSEAQRLGLPPVLFGLDSVHGATYVRGATLFGQQIALAATFDRELVKAVGRVTARDTVAAGVPWLFAPILDLATQPAFPRVYETFGEDPFLVSELGVAIIGGIQSDTGDAQIPRAAACAKHFFAYSAPANGHDRSPVFINEATLRDYYLRPFAAAVQQAQVASVMESYNELNGVPIAASKKWLRDVLRGELGFGKLLVTDWGEINNLHSFHHAVPSQEAAVLLAMERTSIDMSMVPLDDGFIRHLSQLVRAGAVPMARLDESVSRVLEAKQWLGLLHAPVPSRQSALLAHVGKDKDLALESARASVTLLLNRALQGPRLDKACSAISAETSASTGFDLPNGQFMRSEVASAEACRTRCSWEAACEVWLYQGSWADSHPDWPSCFLKRGGAQLVDGPDGQGNAAGTCAPAPIPPPTLPLQLGGGGARARVLLTGPTSDSLTYQSGGWSVRWQGACADSDFEAGGETVRQALARLLPANVELVHTAGCVIRAPTHATATCGGAAELNATLAAALSADVAVVAIGEEAYTEKPGDIDDLDLHAGQLELVRRLAAAAPRLPIVLVLIAGRPRLLRGLPQLPSVVGVVWAGVPGPHGGTAIGEVLLGLTNPSGRLPITYPALPNALGTHYQSVSARCSGSAGGYLSGGTTDCPVEWPFGHGLSYTRFEYSHMATTPSRVLHPGQFGVRLTVSNVGSVGGRHSVLLFASQEYRSGGVAPETQRLVGFTNVFLQPGESAQVELSVSTQLFAYHSEQMVELVESGMYKLHAAYGDSSVQADVSVSAAGLGATMLGPAGGREGEGYGRTSATTLPWMAIVVSGSVLTTTCFICGAFLAALVLRRLRLRNGAVKSSYDAPGETELPEADRNGFSSLSRRSMYGWLQWKSAANLDVTRNNSIGDQMSDLQSAPSRTYA